MEPPLKALSTEVLCRDSAETSSIQVIPPCPTAITPIGSNPSRSATIFIEDEQRAALRVIKERDGIPESEQIRRAIDLWVESKGVARAARKRSAPSVRSEPATPQSAEAAMTPSGNGRTVHAAVYARVSTFDQDPENQLAELRRYVEARGDHGRASLPAAPRWKRSHATPSTFRTQHSSDGRKTASASGPIECVCRT